MWTQFLDSVTAANLTSRNDPIAGYSDFDLFRYRRVFICNYRSILPKNDIFSCPCVWASHKSNKLLREICLRFRKNITVGGLLAATKSFKILPGTTEAGSCLHPGFPVSSSLINA